MANLSMDEIRRTVENLCSVENKIAGSEAEKSAARYLTRRLSECGLEDIEEEVFKVHLWNPVSCLLRVTRPIQREIKAAVFPYSMSSKVTGPLVRFQSANPEIHDGNNGMIGITGWGSDLYLGPMRAYFHALDQEAKAAIIVSPEAGNLNKVVVISAGALLKIPVVNVTEEDGAYLYNLLESGPVTVQLELDVEYSEHGESRNLITKVESTSGAAEEVVVAAHFDSWFKGAADSSAAAAIVVELARLFHGYVRKGGELRRNLRFLLFGAQESGSTDFYYWCNGSKAYVKNHKDIVKNTAAVLSMNSVGYPAPASNYIGATSDLLEFTRVVTPQTSGPKIEYYDPPGYGSDHWFFETAGVPSIYCVGYPSHLYHTQKDDPEHLDYDAVRFYAEFMMAALVQLTNSEVLPLDIFRPLTTFQTILSGFVRSKDNSFDLSELLSKINRITQRRRQFEKEVKRLLDNGTTAERKNVNRFLMSAARMMNKTIGWVWRASTPDDISYLARLEMIADYISLDKAIRALRSMPVSNVGLRSAIKLDKQKENPYNWMRVHKPLALLEEERSKVYQEVESEMSNLTRLLDSISTGLSSVLPDR